MAGKSNAGTSKMALTLDEYYERHVRDKAGPSSRSENAGMVMQLTLDEYYEQFVRPKEQAERQSHGYERTHYFRANLQPRL